MASAVATALENFLDSVKKDFDLYKVTGSSALGGQRMEAIYAALDKQIITYRRRTPEERREYREKRAMRLAEGDSPGCASV